MQLIRIHIVLFFTLSSVLTHAQQHMVSVVPAEYLSDCLLVQDSLSIIPSSISIWNDDANSSIPYKVENDRILLDSDCSSITDTLTVKYSTFPFNFEEQYRSEYHQLFTPSLKPIISNTEKTTSNSRIIDSEELDYNGTFARGISLGNSQDFLLNSNFNMTMTGDIGDGIKIKAAISDDNIPIQPQGNTQLIQDFDRVFIEISKDSSHVLAGDYRLFRPEGYFINVNKKIKGLQVGHKTSVKNGSVAVTGNAAISRGKYARQILAITEGNHGPYRLVGNDNERFIIILSGTEKVYLDGQLMTRGLNNDYIIDYNSAEITFTPKRLIGRESRIIVEYEYRDQRYVRTLYGTNIQHKSGKFTTNLNFHTEQDSKNALGDITLDSLLFNEIKLLGDQFSDAYLNAINQVENDIDNQITYIKVANPTPQDPDGFYLLYSTDASATLYTARFSEISDGGDYIIDNENTANGRVYKYVGNKEGRYDPVIKIPPPLKKQMTAINTTYESDQQRIFSEISLSNEDLNRLSDLDKQDNIGWAGYIDFTQGIMVDSSANRSIALNANYEYTNENFKALNQYRSQEFLRDWNLDDDLASDQHIINTTLTYQHNRNIQLIHQARYLNTNNNYQGIINHSTGKIKIDRQFITLDVSHLKSQDKDNKSRFLRPRLNYDFTTDNQLKISARYDGEINKRYESLSSDSLLNSSRGFHDYSLSLSKSINSLDFDVSYSQRYDLYPTSLSLRRYIDTKEYTTSTRYSTENQGIALKLGMRNSKAITHPDAPEVENKKSIVGLIKYNANFSDAVSINTFFSTTSGQEPKQEFIFEKVENGQGQYIYIGNEDSTLVNANFRYAPDIGNANYIRINQYNTEYILTQNNSLTQSIAIRPGAVITDKEKFKKILSKMILNHNIRIQKKTSADNLSPLNTFRIFSSDDNTALYQSNIGNVLLFNKGERAYDIKIGHNTTHNVITQISNKESRNRNVYFFEMRVGIAKYLDATLNMNRGNKEYTSDTFSDRNYDINTAAYEGSISYRPRPSIRIIMSYQLDRQRQTLNNEEKSSGQSIRSNITFRNSNSLNLSTEIEYTKVKFDGKENSILEFEMLEGLKNGNNILWRADMTKRLRQNLDLNISYQGRKNGDNNPIHIARAQIRATF